MMIELFQSARLRVLETTYLRMLFMRSVNAASATAVGQNAAQICQVRRPSRNASALIARSML
jgi:hypothetical protein